MTDAPPEQGTAGQDCADPAPWPAWLGPRPEADPDGTTALADVGGDRPVLRVPAELGRPVLAQLLAREADRLRLGPVLYHRLSQATYWWMRPESLASDDYPPGCRLLADCAVVAVPAPGAAYCTVAQWLHLPDREQWSGAVWLAKALRDQEAAIAAAAQAAAIAAHLDMLTWTPGRCDYCPDSPEVMVTVAEGDMESGAGYHGTFCRSHLKLALAMNGHQANRLAMADALNAKLDAHRRRYAAEAAQ